MNTLSINITTPRTTQLRSGYQILTSVLNEILADTAAYSKIAVLGDANFAKAQPYLWNTIKQTADNAVFEFTAREENKCHLRKQELETWLADCTMDRKSMLVVAGGGITSDLGGYLAATFKRGIEWMVIPTTLLSMVDASIGGKVGVNTAFGKNMIGAFHLPKWIISDIQVLSTLPRREILSGMGEWLKTFLLMDEKIYRSFILFLEQSKFVDTLLNAQRDVETAWLDSDRDAFYQSVASFVFSAQQYKWSMVREDPLEKLGKRMQLNYGHTFAHALEVGTNFKYSHGEAVVWGIHFANFVACQKGILEGRWYAEIQEDFRNAGVYTPLVNIPETTPLVNLMAGDKKNWGDQIHFVFITKPGFPFCTSGQHVTYAIPKQEVHSLVDLFIEKNG